ncbi:MAG: hypothetical protein K8E66_07240 [Phycisphaerales bacterium]|nr:hypothetical protein [Phycisphaerales bacterium]
MIAVAGLASADVIVSYSYTDLDGTYDASSGTFSAEATDNGTLATGGDVSLLIGAKGTAEFDTGFFGLGGLADVDITMSISNVTGSSADGVGMVTLTDTDGDILSASFTGIWNIINPIGFMFFSGTADDYEFTDNGQADGVFNGTTGSFDMSSLVGNLFDGAISLLLRNPGGFGDDFAKVSTQGDGILIPTPGAVLIASVGALGMIAPRRRR